MSSLPSTEGVQALRQLLTEFNTLTQRAKEIRPQLKELAKIEEELVVLHRSIIASLEHMDVKADGNFGWDRRVVWFLNELNAQAAKQKGEEHGT